MKILVQEETKQSHTDNTREEIVRQWYATGEAIARNLKRVQWEVADWVLAGMGSGQLPADVYSAAEKLFPQYTRTSLQNMASVARAFPASLRSEALAFGHHKAVMAAGPSLRAEWLAKAEGNGWGVHELEFQLQHFFYVKEAEKEFESNAATVTEEPPAVPTAKPDPPKSVPPKPANALMLSHLPSKVREKLDQLANARHTTTLLLVTKIIEAYLEQEVEELHAMEERAIAAIVKEIEVAAKVASEAKDREAEILANLHGGEVATYRVALDEWAAREVRRQDYRTTSDYAIWRANKMEGEAWALNAEWNARRGRAAQHAAESQILTQ